MNSSDAAHFTVAIVSKATILAYPAGVPDACAADVATTLGLSLPAAGMDLLRLARSGLVSRTFDRQYGCYFHTLTEKGRQRLAYLNGGAR